MYHLKTDRDQTQRKKNETLKDPKDLITEIIFNTNSKYRLKQKKLDQVFHELFELIY